MSEILEAKDCHCQFCEDYKRLTEILPKLCEEDQAWLRTLTDAHWQMCDDLDMTKNLKIPQLEEERSRYFAALVKIKSVSHLTSSCEHPEGKCPYRIANEALHLPDGEKEIK